MHAHAGTRPWRGEDARDWELPTRFRTAFRSSDVLIPVHTVPAGDLASRRSGDKVDSNNHESEDSRECLHRKRKLSGRRADNPIIASDKRAVQQPSAGDGSRAPPLVKWIPRVGVSLEAAQTSLVAMQT